VWQVEQDVPGFEQVSQFDGQDPQVLSGLRKKVVAQVVQAVPGAEHTLQFEGHGEQTLPLVKVPAGHEATQPLL